MVPQTDLELPCSHEHVTDEEFETIAADVDSEEPVTRQFLIRLGTSNRDTSPPTDRGNPDTLGHEGSSLEEDEGDHGYVPFNSPEGAEMYDESDVRDAADALYHKNTELKEQLAEVKEQGSAVEKDEGEHSGAVQPDPYRPLRLPEAPLSVQQHNKLIWNLKHLPVKAGFYTIGYAGRDIDQFVAVLEAVDIATLVDIRHTPVSQYKPDFSKENLKARLSNHGIRYVHRSDWGVPLEVRARSVGQDSRDGIWEWYDDNVVPRISNGDFAELRKKTKPPLAFMCTEYAPTDCHRHRLFRPLEEAGLKGFDL